MIGLLQRVTDARVEAGDATIAEIGIGLLVLVAIERGDTEVQAERLLERLFGYRVFPDVEGKMNRSLQDIGGGLLLRSTARPWRGTGLLATVQRGLNSSDDLQGATALGALLDVDLFRRSGQPSRTVSLDEKGRLKVLFPHARDNVVGAGANDVTVE